MIFRRKVFLLKDLPKKISENLPRNEISFFVRFQRIIGSWLWAFISEYERGTLSPEYGVSA